jgi:hypothetical protein
MLKVVTLLLQVSKDIHRSNSNNKHAGLLVHPKTMLLDGIIGATTTKPVHPTMPVGSIGGNNNFAFALQHDCGAWTSIIVAVSTE